MNEHIKIWVDRMQNPDKNIRAEAALGLGKTQDPAAVLTLLQALRRETDPFVQENITWACVRLGAAAVDPLLDLLHDSDPKVRHAAVHTLGKIKDARAVGALINALHDTDITVKSKAAFALGQLDDSSAIPALVHCLGQGERLFQSTLNSVLESFGEPVLAPLIQVLLHGQSAAREQAADILGMMGDFAVIEPLSQLLDDPDWQVRISAVTALGHIGTPAAKRAAQPAVRDSDERVRGLASRILG